MSVKDAYKSPTGSPNKKFLKKQTTTIFGTKNFIYIQHKDIYQYYNFEEKVGEGKTINNNILMSLLGSFGSVFRARDLTSKEIFAIKAINLQNAYSEELLNNEIEVLKMLDHPNIIKLHEVFIDSNFLYLVMEYMEAGDLYDYIKQEKCLSEKKVASIMIQLFSAINHLHSINFVHRDIKPENIVLYKSHNNSDEIEIKIIDFGTSVLMQNGALSQELGTVNL